MTEAMTRTQSALAVAGASSARSESASARSPLPGEVGAFGRGGQALAAAGPGGVGRGVGRRLVLERGARPAPRHRLLELRQARGGQQQRAVADGFDDMARLARRLAAAETFGQVAQALGGVRGVRRVEGEIDGARRGRGGGRRSREQERG